MALIATATVDVTGVGSTLITLTNTMGFPNSSVAREINVFPLLSLDLQSEFVTMEPGDTQQLTVIGSFGAAGSDDLTAGATGTTYEAVPGGIVSISADGLVTALTTGTATVTASNNPTSNPLSITVADQVTKIAYIAGSLPPNDADQAAVDHLKSLRFSGDPGQLDMAGGLQPQVEAFDDNAADPAFIDANFDLLIGSSTMSSSQVGGDYRCLNIPFIYWEQALNRPEREGMTASGGSTDPFPDIFIRNTSHPITEGFTPDDLLVVFDSDQTQSLAEGALAAGVEPNGVLAAFDPADPLATPLLMAAESGGLRVDGASVFLGRRVFLWLDNNSFDNLNADGLTIFDRSVNWALGGTREALVPESLRLSASRIELCPPGLTFGGSGAAQLRVVGVAQGGCPVNLTDPIMGTTYVSSAPAVATVDASGLVTMAAEGVTMVTAANGGLSATLELTVTPTARQPGFVVETFEPGLAPRAGLLAEALVQVTAPPDTVASDLVIDYRDSDDAGAGGDFEPSLEFPGLSVGVDDQDFVIRATGFLRFDTTDPVDLRIHSDDGYALFINGVQVQECDCDRGPSQDTFTYTPPNTGFLSVELIFWERGGGAELEFSQVINGTPVLVNAPNDPRALRAFQSVPCLPDEPTGPPPQFVQVMGNMGSAPDTFTSPLGEDVAFTTVSLDLSVESELVSGAGMTLVSNGGGNHTLTLDTPVPPGDCVALSFDVADLATGVVGTIAITLCHLPLDVNQDGQVSIGDITAWGNEFNGARRGPLVDTNGDGNVNVQDATAVGNNWFGRPPATVAWFGASLP